MSAYDLSIAMLHACESAQSNRDHEATDVLTGIAYGLAIAIAIETDPISWEKTVDPMQLAKRGFQLAHQLLDLDPSRQEDMTLDVTFNLN